MKPNEAKQLERRVERLERALAAEIDDRPYDALLILRESDCREPVKRLDDGGENGH